MSSEPLRMCVACRTRRPQRSLLRVVRTSTGTMCVDEDRHRAAGRGAYLCPDDTCIRLAERRGAFRRALRGDPPVTLAETLRQAAERRRQQVSHETALYPDSPSGD